MKNKKIILLFILVLLISIFGVSFALYNYNKTSKNSKLIVGDIYMHYKESNEAILTTAEDTSRFYLDGYLVNSAMASQEYQTLPDNRNELSKCVDYFDKKNINYDDGTTGITFCQGTGTLYGSTFQTHLDNNNLDNTMLTELKELNIVTSDNKINSIMASQTYEEKQSTDDTRNELSKCTDYFYSKYGTSGLSNISQKKYNYLKNNKIIKIASSGVRYTKSDYIEFCKGTGSINNISLKKFISSGVLSSEYLTELSSMEVIKENNGILSSLETGNLTLNENIKNQTYQEDTRNELSKCMNFFENHIDDGSTSETFCKGTGTLNGMSIYDNLATCNSSGGGSYSNNNNDNVFALPLGAAPSGFKTEVCNYLYNNNIAVSEKEQLPYFEFTIDGKNTSNKDIIYNVKLIHGDVVSSKTESNRISDKFLMFKLVEVVDDNEVELVNDKKFDTINNTILYSDKVLKNTNTEINHTYRLYMIVDPNLMIGNLEGAVYSFEEYANLFASIKVNVDGNYE